MLIHFSPAYLSQWNLFWNKIGTTWCLIPQRKLALPGRRILRTTRRFQLKAHFGKDLFTSTFVDQIAHILVTRVMLFIFLGKSLIFYCRYVRGSEQVTAATNIPKLKYTIGWYSIAFDLVSEFYSDTTDDFCTNINSEITSDRNLHLDIVPRHEAIQRWVYW